MNKDQKPGTKDQRTRNKDRILELASRYAHEAYALSRELPKDELFGITSQFRRAALSVPLNIVEGHARATIKNRLNFCRIAFGSLKESQFIVEFCIQEDMLRSDQAIAISKYGDELAAMLWHKIKTMESINA